ncbi:MAG: homoserine O-acetyltransferase [Opitutales bacterium]|nr:homoserine O-acetyltransferase [Opitutales bacterium]NRA26059.1 homoserine O-acetyltransferase [Opitutales bacterium]
MNDAQDNWTRDNEGEVGLVEPRDFLCTEPFYFEAGGVLLQFTIRYETYGRLNEARDNAIIIGHAVSGDHHVAGVHSITDRKTGWWNHIVGPGKPIDTNKFFVICSNCIGGCQGTTGPSSINPETGVAYGLDFPVVSIGDMVHAQKRLLDHLEIETLHAVVGGSMGGMQALAWATLYPSIPQRILGMATTARQNSQAIAFNEVGRSAIMQDPDWRNGNYTIGEGPKMGLAIARMMAHITYLSDRGLESKFGRNRRNTTDAVEEPGAREMFEVEFEVESYLRYQGRSFVNRFDANTYLYFTKALDRFDLYKGHDSLAPAFKDVQARSLIIGFTSDWLFPPEQNQDIVYGLLEAKKDASYLECAMDLGHDSFLLKSPDLYRIVEGFLNDR